METSNFQTAFLNFVDFSQLTNWEVRANKNDVEIFSQFEIISLRDVLNDLTSMRKIKLLDDVEYQEPTLSSKDNSISIRKKGKGLDFKVKDRVLIQRDDLVISKMHTQNGLFAFADQEYHSTSTFIPFAIKENIDRNYLFILLKPTLARLYKNDTVNRETYSVDEILDLKIPLPDINTQKALAQAYQDKMAKADELEKQANQNFSGCLDEILGIDSKKTEYPKSKLIFVHSKDIDKWGVHQIINPDTDFSNLYPIKTIQELCKVGSGGTPSRSQSDYYRGSIPWVKTGEVVNDIILDTEEHISEQAIADSSAKLYPAESLIIAMYGQGLTRGRTAKLGIDATTNQACAVLSEIKSDEILTDYLWVYLMNEYDRLRALASGNNQPNLNGDMIKNYPVVIPDLEKQAQIASYIQTQKQQQKDNLTAAAAYRAEALMEFEKAIFK